MAGGSKEGLYYTNDGGTSWSKVLNNVPYDYLFNADGSIVTINNDYKTNPNSNKLNNKHLIRSKDEGKTWDTLIVTNLDSNLFLNEIVYSNSDSIIILAWHMSNSLLLKTIDGGDSWQLDSLPDYWRGEVKAINFNTIFMMNHSALMKSTDAGKTFIEIPDVWKHRLTSLKSLSVRNQFVAVSCSSYQIISNADSIVAHLDENHLKLEYDTVATASKPSIGFDKLDMLSKDYGWAIVWGTPYKLNQISTSVEEINNGERESLTVFPNPFHEFFSIKWTGNYSSLIIQDLSGKEVHNRKLNPFQKKLNIKIVLDQGLYVGYLLGSDDGKVFKLISH